MLPFDLTPHRIDGVRKAHAEVDIWREPPGLSTLMNAAPAWWVERISAGYR